MVNGHLRPEIEGSKRIGGTGRRDWGGAGADHQSIEKDVGFWMCDVAHVTEEVPGLGAAEG